MFQPNIKRELEKQRSRNYYQENREVYLERQKIYNRKVDYSKNKTYKHNYYLEQKKKTRVSNEIKLLGKTNSNEENTGLIVLIKNMKSRKYQKQKREAEIMKRNLLFEFKQIHGDKEPYLFVRQYPIETNKKVGRKRTRQGYYKKIEKQIVLSFN